jgi:4'-phosphopantetheinyl transferase EntD
MLRHASDDLFHCLLPADVVTEMARVRDVADEIHPEERACITGVAPCREREFVAGRVCARRALARIGVFDCPVLVGFRGEPIWPAGVVGSVTHCADLCAVAIASGSTARSIGIDVERVGAIPPALYRTICTPQELHWVAQFPVDRQEEAIALIFSAKECVYKCRYPIDNQWLDFMHVRVSPWSDLTEFTASLRGVAAGRWPSRFEGRARICDDHVFTAITLRRP